jgi:hypothetical protein
VWNRVSFKLKKKRIRNSPDMWIRADRAFPAIVECDLFSAAQAIIRARSARLSDEEMLNALCALSQQQGMLSGLIIDENEEMPSSSAYRHRFGSLIRAYSLVGYRPRRDFHYIEINRLLRRPYPDMIETVVAGLERAGGTVQRDPGTGLIVVNNEFYLSVVIARCRKTLGGVLRWRLRFERGGTKSVRHSRRQSVANGVNRA